MGSRHSSNVQTRLYSWDIGQQMVKLMLETYYGTKKQRCIGTPGRLADTCTFAGCTRVSVSLDFRVVVN